MPFVTSDGADIYWKVEGEADRPRLVLLNSIGIDMDLWSPVLPLLRERLALLRIDTRGHGASDAPPGDYSLAGLARDVAAAMDAAGWPRAQVAGVSLGGMIAMQMALDMPERVTSLIPICTSATMDRDAWTARVDTVRRDGMAGIVDLAMQRFLSPAFIAERPGHAATIRHGLLAMRAEGYAGCAAAIRDMALADRLDGIACPTLVISGERDSSTPYAGHGDHLVSTIPNARHIALPAAHLSPIEAPDALANAILNDWS